MPLSSYILATWGHGCSKKACMYVCEDVCMYVCRPKSVYCSKQPTTRCAITACDDSLLVGSCKTPHANAGLLNDCGDVGLR
jgi:hypothetical protein